ncbi:hypothetical protein PROFUN_02675 [Planoprotostelium fungivorum]|uniref:EamA domain-containing protein n=1 Tax=Planoprotostelium fungivorum TaxID=1890364 RepID=A0A2P6NVP7_9EUKA|nr:hypothetical protein PROFUN_02675 [Planoprotostelium fungivorum]
MVSSGLSLGEYKDMRDDNDYDVTDAVPLLPKEEEEETNQTSGWISFVVALVTIVSLVAMTEFMNLQSNGAPYQTFWFSASSSIFVFPVYLIHQLRTRDGVTVSGILNESMKCGFASWTRFLLMVVPSTILFTTQFYMYLKGSYMAPSSTVIAIFNGSAGLIYILSVFVLKERFSWLKMIAVLVCIGGVIMVALASGGGSESFPLSWLGEVFAAVSAVILSVYLIHFNYYIRKPIMGLICLYISTNSLTMILLLWIPIPIFNFTGIEACALPVDYKQWLYVIGVAVSILSSNLAVWIGTPYTSPTFIAIANILAIPCSYGVDMLKDYLTKGIRPVISPLFIAGIVLIILGFIVLNFNIGRLFKRMMNRRTSKNYQRT